MFLYQKSALIILFICLAFVAGAQQKRADKLFEKSQYYKAIPAYRKAINTKNIAVKQYCLIRLADCYRILNDYNNAVVNYKAALVLGKVVPEVYYNYGTVLKSTNNFGEALNNFMFYLETKPTDKKAIYAVKACQEIKYWLTKPTEYSISAVEKVNTNRSEFCASVYNNKLIFTGEKQNDLIELTTNDLNGAPFLNVYSSDIKNADVKYPKQFSSKVNTGFHDGPVSFSGNGTYMYLTRVNDLVNKRNKNFVNHAKIYISQNTAGKWSSLQPFSFNSDEYSCAHAAASADGNTLFFTSDMPGGYGGKDIWMCNKFADKWQKPLNLGPDINTSADEMFPYSRADGKLYFSSTGLPGFGGMDIFSAKLKNGIWLLNRNESLLLNSTADDFGIFFVNDSIGYFSSNRAGGKGNDDIYSFIYTNK